MSEMDRDDLLKIQECIVKVLETESELHLQLDGYGAKAASKLVWLGEDYGWWVARMTPNDEFATFTKWTGQGA